jgi:hypothetical protein
MELRLVETVTPAELAAAGVHTTIGFSTADGLRVLAAARKSTALALIRDAIGLGAQPSERGNIQTTITANSLTGYDILFIIRTGIHNSGNAAYYTADTARPVMRRDRRADAKEVRAAIKAKAAQKAWDEGKPMKGKMRILGGKK